MPLRLCHMDAPLIGCTTSLPTIGSLSTKLYAAHTPIAHRDTLPPENDGAIVPVVPTSGSINADAKATARKFVVPTLLSMCIAAVTPAIVSPDSAKPAAPAP